jgi:hypothetical protein
MSHDEPLSNDAVAFGEALLKRGIPVFDLQMIQVEFDLWRNRYMEKREIVQEHRITKVICLDGGRRWTIRWWIEGSPEYGGILDWQVASQAVQDVDQYLVTDSLNVTVKALAHWLFALLPAANSIEVCDELGNGICLHRDWP